VTRCWLAPCGCMPALHGDTWFRNRTGCAPFERRDACVGGLLGISFRREQRHGLVTYRCRRQATQHQAPHCRLAVSLPSRHLRSGAAAGMTCMRFPPAAALCVDAGAGTYTISSVAASSPPHLQQQFCRCRAAITFIFMTAPRSSSPRGLDVEGSGERHAGTA